MEHRDDVVGQRRRLYADGVATEDDLGRPIDDLDHIGGAPQTLSRLVRQGVVLAERVGHTYAYRLNTAPWTRQ